MGTVDKWNAHSSAPRLRYFYSDRGTVIAILVGPKQRPAVFGSHLTPHAFVVLRSAQAIRDVM